MTAAPVSTDANDPSHACAKEEGHGTSHRRGRQAQTVIVPTAFPDADYRLAQRMMNADARRASALHQSDLVVSSRCTNSIRKGPRDDRLFQTDPGRPRQRIAFMQLESERSDRVSERHRVRRGNGQMRESKRNVRSRSIKTGGTLRAQAPVMTKVNEEDENESQGASAQGFTCHEMLAGRASHGVEESLPLASPFHVACKQGDYSVLKHMLGFSFGHDQSTLVNAHCGCGMTPLQIACEEGDVRVAKLLLRHHADPNLSGKKRHRSCLVMAVAARHQQLIELLLDHGVVLTEEALLLCCSKGEKDILTILLNGRRKRSFGVELVSSFTHRKAPVQVIDDEVIIKAADVAIRWEHPELVPMLLGDGKSIVSRRRICLAAIESASNGSFKLLKILVKRYGPELLLRLRDQSCQGTLLHLVAPHACMNSVVLLIRLGVDVNARDGRGITPLYMACARGHTSIARVLLNAGAMCFPMGPNGETPLHIAAQENHLGCIQAVLTHGDAKVDSRTSDGCTALHLACQRGNTHVAECLLNHGADINALNSSRESALIKATRMRHSSTVKLLLAHNADEVNPILSPSPHWVESLPTCDEGSEAELACPRRQSVTVKGSTHSSLKRWFRSVVQKEAVAPSA